MLNGSYLWDTETVHSGEKSVAIRGTRYRYGRWRSDKLPVSHDGYSWYTFTGWVKTERNGGEVYLAIAWLDGKGHLITTSDSPMLPTDNSEWQQVSISALPAEGAVSLELWCISNHNGGQTWFDDLALTLLSLPAKSSASYDAFLNDYPTHSLAVDAHRMRLQSIYTQAKWTKEKASFATSQQQPDQIYREATDMFIQASAMPRLDDILSTLLPAKALIEEQQRYEMLVDQALLQAALCANNARDYALARSSLEQIVQRNQNEPMVERAQANLNALARMGQ